MLQQFQRHVFPIAKTYGSVNEVMYHVARISYGVQVLARVPGFGHPIELRELGITINNLSVHGHAASAPAVITEAQEED